MHPINKKDERAFGRRVIGWSPVHEGISYRVSVRYWDSKYKMWTTNSGMAYLYASRERAEKTAFNLAAKDPTLIGEIEVLEITPLEKVKP